MPRAIAGGAVALAMTLSLTAQTYVTSPPGSDTRSGSGEALVMFHSPSYRLQLADGLQRGAGMVVKGLSFRLPAYPSGAYGHAARSYSMITLAMSETLVPSMTRTLSGNALTTPTQVFRNRFALPGVSGPHTAIPAPWSIHFPFGSPWNYSGSRDILADFDFAGGQLANSGSWWKAYYTLDAPLESSPVAFATAQTMGTGCIDSRSRSPAGMAMHSFSYNPRDRFQPKSGRLVLEQYGAGFPADAPVVSVFGFQPNATGVPLPGVRCSRVHVGLQTPIILHPMRSLGLGMLLSHYPATGAGGIPFQSSFVGIPVVCQAAWDDSLTGALQLSKAAHLRIPGFPRLYDLVGLLSLDRSQGDGGMFHPFNPVRSYAR